MKPKKTAEYQVWKVWGLGLINERDGLKKINDDLLAALVRLEGSTRHRNGDCYSDDYRGLCVCGKEAAQNAILRAGGGANNHASHKIHLRILR